MSIYSFKVKDNKQNEVELSKYKGKVLLIVNTATECGFTPQYEELQNLYEKLNSKGLEILDFPCNQFGNQAPGSSEEIAQFCSTRFGVTFPQFDKVEVNGENAIDLYKYLVNEKGFGGFDPSHPLTSVLNGILGKLAKKDSDSKFDSNRDIRWNFTKFLIDKEGNVVERFEPTENIKNIEKKVNELL
jgi:hypothetical protein